MATIGGYGRALLRHLQRRGPQDREALLAHFVDGAHNWHPETLDAAIGELIETGYLFEPGADGIHTLVVRMPL